MNFSVLSNPLFNSAFSKVQKSEFMGPAFVNLSAMVIPRTAIDYGRNEQAGKETLRREGLSFFIGTLLYPLYYVTAGRLIKDPKVKSLVGLATVAASAFSVQFVNKYLTKQETGSDSFVGLPGYEGFSKKKTTEEKKKGINIKLWAEKAASVTAITYLAGAAITGKINPKKIIENFKVKDIQNLNKPEEGGRFLLRNQIMIYSCSNIIGRFLAARDENEVREDNIRDIPTFLNWLVLDNFVAKFTAFGLAGKKLFTEAGCKIKEGGFFKNIGNIIKSPMKLAGDIGDNSELMGKRNVAIGSGLLYAGVMLGWALPTLNTKITNATAGQKNHEPIVSPFLQNELLVGSVEKLK